MEETKVINDENPKDGVKQEPTQPQPSKGECPDLKDLSEKEQKSPIAWKWVQSEINRLQGYEKKYLDLKEDYNQIDKDFAVHKQSSRNNVVIDITSSLMLAIGPALVGLTPSVGSTEEEKYMKWIIGGIGGLLLIASIIVKSLPFFKKS